MTTASTAGNPTFRENRFLHWLCIGLFAAFALAAYRPDTYFDWALENGVVVFGFVPLMYFLHRRFVFSDLSYLLMFLFMCFHEFGAHYKYSDVPLGEWMKALLHTQRNDFDRVAHFGFGLMFAYPIREIAMRLLKVSGRWVYYLPVECTLALSAIYEMLEAFMASVLSPQRGEEFVGMQGDMWDSQEDMFVAGLGSVVAVLIIAVVVKLRAGKKKELAEYAVASK